MDKILDENIFGRKGNNISFITSTMEYIYISLHRDRSIPHRSENESPLIFTPRSLFKEVIKNEEGIHLAGNA